MKLNHTPRRALILSVLALTLAGCASKGSQPVSSQSIAAPPKHLLTAADIAKAPADSPERAFLRHWSYLQNLSWDAALSDYEPALARYIGVARLLDALKLQASYFPTAKPLLRGTRRVGGGEFVIRYSVPNGYGQLVATSISWRRVNRAWKIHYDTQLDGMLQSAAQTRVQDEIDPNAPQPAKKAIQAGIAAARLQSQYLQSTYRGQSAP
jgi:hypothetical protein